MLVRLLYVSRAAHELDSDAVTSLLKTSREHNASTGVTGVLCWCGNERIFLQVLEGSRSAVNALFNKIGRDARHSGIELLTYDEISERSFASWPMGQVNMGRLNPALVLKYSQSAALDPYAVPGPASLALFNELVATASVAAHS